MSPVCWLQGWENLTTVALNCHMEEIRNKTLVTHNCGVLTSGLGELDDSGTELPLGRDSRAVSGLSALTSLDLSDNLFVSQVGRTWWPTTLSRCGVFVCVCECVRARVCMSVVLCCAV